MQPIAEKQIWRKMIRIESLSGTHNSSPESYTLTFNAKEHKELEKVLQDDSTIRKVIEAIKNKNKISSVYKKLLGNNVYWDKQQPASLREYWAHDFFKKPNWEKIITECYYTPNCAIIWNWKRGKRLERALFIDKFFKPTNGEEIDIINDFNKALFIENKNGDTTNKIDSFYIKNELQVMAMNLYPEKVNGHENGAIEYLKVAEMLFSCHFKLYPYIQGHLYKALPLPGREIGKIDEERIVSSPNVRKAFKDLSDKIWGNPEAKIIYVSGAPGAGKEGYCKSIHFGKASAGEVITADMTNSDEQQVREKLFGREIQGQFIPGDIEKAENGTLVLDEINKPGDNIRSLLLRPLESKEYYPLDSAQVRKVADVVFVLASPKSFSKIVKDIASKKKPPSDFPGPEDLWSRIKVDIHIEHPFSLSTKHNKVSIVKNFFMHFWVQSFAKMIGGIDVWKIHTILRKITDSRVVFEDHKNCFHPQDIALANKWKGFVYSFDFSTANTKQVTNVNKGPILAAALDAVKPNIANRLDKKSIRIFRNSVDKIARQIYNEEAGRHSYKLKKEEIQNITETAEKILRNL